jgi:hypothetical protein
MTWTVPATGSASITRPQLIRQLSRTRSEGSARPSRSRPAAFCAGLDEELPVRHQLRQREVEARRGARPRVHRDAEAGPAGLAAVHRDDERALPAGSVPRVGVAATKEHPVLDRDRAQFAGPHSDEREPLRRLLPGGTSRADGGNRYFFSDCGPTL